MSYLPIAQQAAARYFQSARDQQIFVRQMNQEAHGQDLTSPAGAQGPAQIMPGTAKAWGVKNVHDPNEAYNAAAKNMATYLHQYGGDWAKALTAYNAGPGAVGRALPAETQNYIKTILGGADVKLSGGSPTSTTKTTTTPASTHTNVDSAIVDLLSTHPKGGTMAHALNRMLASGQYDETTPASTSTVTTTHAGTPAAATAGKGVASFEGKQVAGWIAPILEFARTQGWKGQINSGYRSLADQTRIYNSGVRPAAKPGTSNHEFTAFPGGAIDVSDAATLSKILQGSKYGHLLVWAGSKDSVHFSHPHNGSY